MAEPLRNDNVYDDHDENPVTRPQLEGIKGGGETTTPRAGHLQAVPNSTTASNEAGSSNPNLKLIQGGEAAGASDQGTESEKEEQKVLSDRVGKGYEEGESSANKQSRFSSVKGKLANSKTKRRILFGIAGGLTAGALSIGAFFFGFMNVFKLDHFLSNVEKRAFMRWQVNMDDRSTKWIQAYLTVRLGEVENSGAEVRDNENIIFRANRVDNNNPLTDWYRTLRASKFEEKVFNENGIKFVSVATKQPDGTIQFRPGRVEIDGQQTLTFDPRYSEINAIDDINLNEFNGRLRNFVELEVFDSDKAARREIRKVVNDNLKPWQVYKKRQLRKDIQNMTGVRDWRFFEKTRAAWEEKKISVRNKIILKAMPENTKSGKFVKCIFGVETCRSSPDPSHPDNKSPLSTGNGDFSDSRDSEGMRKQFISKIVSRLNIFTSIATSLETLNNVDMNMRNGSLSKMVAAARAAQAVGLFQVYSTAKDQIKTGEVNTPEVGEFMEYANNIGRNEAWSAVLGDSSSVAYSGGTAYAAAETAKNKEQYCSEEYQALVDAGETDKGEFAYNCNPIGSGSKAAQIENQWTNGPMGKVLGPVLSAYRATPLDDIIGGVLGAVGDAIGFVVNPAVKGALAVLGLQDDVDGAVKWMANSAVDYLGAGPQTDEGTPSSAEGNYVMQGGAASAEATARSHGAALTTATTRQESINRVNAYLHEFGENQSFTQKYFALDNPDSVASKQLFAVATSSAFSSPGTFASSIFNSIGSLPGKLLSFGSVSAQEDTQKPYAASNFAEIDTYDLPAVCINRNVLDATPANSTNADDLGLIPASELTWELLSSNEEFYDRLYANNPDENTALQVYNCELFDNGVRGSLGAIYGYGEKNAIQESGGSGTSDDGSGSDTTGDTGGEISGDAQEIARKILQKNNIDLGSGDGFCRYCEEDIRNTAEGKPAYGNVALDVNLLKFILELSQYMAVNINSITGEGCGHSSDTCKSAGGSSMHYEGKGVDFSCSMTDGSTIDRIGQKYGIKSNYERCDAGINHWHYSIGGR